MYKKFSELTQYLSGFEKQGLCLAFSGGIDSALLLYLCRKMNILAVTFNSNFQSVDEIKLTQELCEKYKVPQRILNVDILSNPIISNNPKDRCYYCKKMLFSQLQTVAETRVILDGTNFDDLSVYRPGRKALKELGVISPFAEFKITKQEIRDYAKECGIEIYNKPSTPCLATRFPYDTKLTQKKLDTVEKGEIFLKDLGFESCRMRIHNDLARIEIPYDKFNALLTKRTQILEALKSLGIKYITLDIEGFRSGSMDE